MRASDPVNPTVPLHQAHRVPREVVVHDIAALLEVHPLGKDVRAEEQVEAVLRVGW